MKKATISFTILFGLGYLLGAMFNGLNTRVWETGAVVCLVTWFFICIASSALIYFTQE